MTSRKTPCADCGQPCQGIRCRPCENANRVRADWRPTEGKPCLWCGMLTTSAKRVCMACKSLENIPEPVPEHAARGRWVRRGLIHVFVRDATAGGRPRLPTVCGTERGYQRHRDAYRKKGVGTWPLPVEDPCGCRAAHTEHNRARQVGREAEVYVLAEQQPEDYWADFAERSAS